MKRRIVSCTSAVLCLVASGIAISDIALAQQTPDATAQLRQEMGQEAMKYIASRFVIDSSIMVPQTKKPLSGQGVWSVSQTRPAACPNINNPCVLVSYAEPGTDIVCQWTVVLRGGVDRDFLVDLNEDAARYLTQNPAAKSANLGLIGSSDGKLIRSVPPRYPLGAVSIRAQGIVKMMVQVDETGRPSEVKVISGPDVFRDSAVDSVKQWRYEPLRIDGVPVFVRTLMVINFHMG
jgi:TonB family protein